MASYHQLCQNILETANRKPIISFELSTDSRTAKAEILIAQ